MSSFGFADREIWLKIYETTRYLAGGEGLFRLEVPLEKAFSLAWKKVAQMFVKSRFDCPVFSEKLC